LGYEQISGALTDNGTALLEGASLTKIIADNPECNVFAFGHFHRPQVLHTATPFAFYAGSIIKNTFSERHDRKVIWLFDGENEFVDDFTIPNRLMYQFDITLSDTPTQELLHIDMPLEGALVKVVYSGTKVALKQVKLENIKEYFNNHGVKELKVVFNVTEKSKARNEKISETASEETILTEYFKDHPNKDIIVTKGLDLIKEVNNG